MSGPWDPSPGARRQPDEPDPEGPSRDLETGADRLPRGPDDAGWDDWSRANRPAAPSTEPISSWDDWPPPAPEPEAEPEVEPEPLTSDPWAESWEPEPPPRPAPEPAWQSEPAPPEPTWTPEPMESARPPVPAFEPVTEPVSSYEPAVVPPPEADTADRPAYEPAAEPQPEADTAHRPAYEPYHETAYDDMGWAMPVDGEEPEPDLEGEESEFEAPSAAAPRSVPEPEPEPEPEPTREVAPEPAPEAEAPPALPPSRAAIAERGPIWRRLARAAQKPVAEAVPAPPVVPEPTPEPEVASAVAEPEPEVASATAEPEPEVASAVAEPEPEVASATAEPEPEVASAVAEPEPEVASAVAEPEPESRPRPIFEPVTAADVEEEVEAEAEAEPSHPEAAAAVRVEPSPPEAPAALGAEAPPTEAAPIGAAPRIVARPQIAYEDDEESEILDEDDRGLRPTAGRIETSVGRWLGTERRQASTAEQAVPWLIGIILLLAGMVVVLMALIFSGEESLGGVAPDPSASGSALAVASAAPTPRPTPRPTTSAPPSTAPTPTPAPAAQFGALEMVYLGRSEALAPIYLLRRDFTLSDDPLVLAFDPALDVRNFAWAPDGSHGAALLVDVLVSIEPGVDKRRLAETILNLTFGDDASTVYAVRVTESGVNDTATVIAIDYASGAATDLTSVTYARPQLAAQETLREAQFADDGGAVRLFWLEDNTLLLWVLGASGWQIEPDTGATTEVGAESLPNLWSPQGDQRIVIAETGSTSSIVLYNADGEEVARTVAEGLVSHMRWAPDGSQVVFTLGRSGAGGGVLQDLFMWNLELDSAPNQTTNTGAAFGAEWLGSVPMWRR